MNYRTSLRTIINKFGDGTYAILFICFFRYKTTTVAPAITRLWSHAQAKQRITAIYVVIGELHLYKVYLLQMASF